jgi:hypothetical protein
MHYGRLRYANRPYKFIECLRFRREHVLRRMRNPKIKWY